MKILRNRRRAAAMVEAAVVIPVMVSFLAVIGLMKNGYDRKITQNQQTRSQVLDYASHNCKSQTIQYSGTSSSSGAGLNTGATSAGESTADGAQGSVGSPKSSGIMAKAEVKSQDGSVGSTRAGIKGRGLSLRVRGETSAALCNEEPEDGSLSGAFSYAKNKLGSLFP
jgi:hypothetical protein